MLLLLLGFLSLVAIEAFEEINATVVICVIVKDEEPYIDEWIAYHIGIGFDHIYIVDNSDDVSMRKALLWPGAPSSKYYPKHITLLHLPGKGMQLNSYYSFTQDFRANNLWAAFIDADEFIVLHKHDNIKQLLYEVSKPFDFHGALSLNWVIFGSNGHKEYTNEPVTKRFTRRSKELDQHVKTIAYLPDVLKFPNPHFPYLSEPNLRYDCDDNILQGSWNNNHLKKQYTVTVDENGEPRPTDSVSESVAVIHHYFTKSEAEFRAKVARGKADRLDKRKWSDFADHDFNEVLDTTAFDKYCSIVGIENCGARIAS